MTRYTFITSMNQRYYDLCGKDMLRSFERYWYPEFDLHIYNEDNFVPQETFCKLKGWNLGKDYINFQNLEKNNRVKTFAKKGFSIIDAMYSIECDRLVWLDADLIIKNKLKQSKLDELMPEDKLSLHFGVRHKKEEKTFFSCETGFFIINKKHKQYKEFCDEYKRIYTQRDNKNLRRFYDGEIYGKTVLKFSEEFMVDLNFHKKYKTPIGKSELRHYIAHRKAGLKYK